MLFCTIRGRLNIFQHNNQKKNKKTFGGTLIDKLDYSYSRVILNGLYITLLPSGHALKRC